MRIKTRGIRSAVKRWFNCRLRRCDYYYNYLAYGPATLTHVGFHAAERIATDHFKNCNYNGRGFCPSCTAWEERLRA